MASRPEEFHVIHAGRTDFRPQVVAIMMKAPAYNQVLLSQYKALPQLVSVPVDSEDAMEVLAAILSREELEGQQGKTLQRSLAAPDRAFAKILSGLGEEWWNCILNWSADCEFASSGWWVSVLTSARQIRGQATSLADVFAPIVDLWVAVVDEPGKWGGELVLRMDKLLLGVSNSVGAVGHSLSPDWNTKLVPAVSYQKSVHIGFALSRKGSGEVDGKTDPQDVEAASLCVKALAILGAEGLRASLDEIIPSEDAQREIRASYEMIRKSLAPDAKMLLNAKASITTTQACIRNVNPPRVKREKKRDLILDGSVRAIDLDAHKLKLRSDNNVLTVLTWDANALFPGEEMTAGMWLDKSVSIRAHTSKRGPIPPTATLLEITLRKNDDSRGAEENERV